MSSSSTQTWIKSLLQNDVLLTYTHDDGTLRYAIDIYEKKVDARQKIDLRGHIQWVPGAPPPSMTAPSLHATSNRLFQAVPLCHTTGGARTGEAPAIRHTWRPVAVRPDRARSSPHTWPQCDARSEAVPSPADGGTRRFRGHGLHSPPPEATWHAGFVNQGLQWAMGADRSGTPAVETAPEVRSVNGEARRWCLIGALHLRARW